MTKPVVHVLGHALLPLDIKQHPEDAQVFACWNFCKLLGRLGLPYLYYGLSDSQLPPDTNGGLVDCGKPTGPWKYGNRWHQIYNARLTRHLAKYLRDDGEPEFVASLYGAPQSDIRVPVRIPVLEPMVGYDHCWAPYRVFPSRAQQNVIYATWPRQTWQTRFFDAVIPHFLDPEEYNSNQTPGDYLLYLGRPAPDKGVELARQFAAASGRPLRVVHSGVYGQAKADLLSGAVALLAPTWYVEPFGYAVIEAQMCGTPVITTDWGAFVETVQPGITGFRCHTQTEFLDAIAQAGNLERSRIRQLARKQFSLEAVAEPYRRYLDFIWKIQKQGGFYGQDLRL